MIIRPAERADAARWLVLRNALWPESRHDHEAEIAEYFDLPNDRVVCLVGELADHGVVGFLEAGLRDYAEGCLSSPVGYLEGIFVLEPHRRGRIGEGLVRAGQAWAHSLGCTEMASDRELDNVDSGHFHEALGYDEVERIVCYRRSL